MGLFLCMPTLTAAQIGANGILYGEGKRDTLRDLTGVEVVVESFDLEGFSSTSLKNDIESQLAQAGIRVFRNKERLDQPGLPYLYVRMSLLRTDLIYSYGLEISLNQTVTLTRYPSISIFAPTWWVHGGGSDESAECGDPTIHRPRVSSKIHPGLPIGQLPRHRHYPIAHHFAAALMTTTCGLAFSIMVDTGSDSVPDTGKTNSDSGNMDRSHLAY